MHPTRIATPLVVLLLAAAALAGPFRPALSRVAHAIGLRHTPASAAPGAPMPALPLEHLDGSSAQLIPRGTVVYNVFASWCPPCNAELPDIMRAERSLAPHGIRFVGIDQGESPTRVAAFIAQKSIPYPVVLDPTNASTSLLGARMIPETLIVRDGIVARIIVGPTTESELREAVQKV